MHTPFDTDARPIWKVSPIVSRVSVMLTSTATCLTSPSIYMIEWYSVLGEVKGYCIASAKHYRPVLTGSHHWCASLYVVQAVCLMCPSFLYCLVSVMVHKDNGYCGFLQQDDFTTFLQVF